MILNLRFYRKRLIDIIIHYQPEIAKCTHTQNTPPAPPFGGSGGRFQSAEHGGEATSRVVGGVEQDASGGVGAVEGGREERGGDIRGGGGRALGRMGLVFASNEARTQRARRAAARGRRLAVRAAR